MSIFGKKIENHLDVLSFFVHLRCDLRVNFNPDERFDDYIMYRTGRPSFTPEESIAYDKVMEDCIIWCDRNDKDIYDLALISFKFPKFLKKYKKLKKKKAIKAFVKKFIDKNYDTDHIIALHTYGNCYWIEEFNDNGQILYQCIIENANPFADNLRDVEVILFDWMMKSVSRLHKL
ncbi:hypothetical protein [Puia dinghuensis]|uniref:Uncharacterized protein n=1 Tax=Puia dinghuensis TaxID=1792502 RepID=A0A8J2UBQ7_9BACT|nr:hypothetical protein [Puia dinghuensis]GGA92511.1 hypothetical protein GCM10011511_14860 [Puia dinghuensis]